MTDAPNAIAEEIAREIWRYNECPWDFDDPPEGMAQLQKQIALDQAAGIASLPAIAALRSSPAREGEWKPIETAPKNGTAVLLFCQHPEAPRITDGFYADEVGRWIDDDMLDVELRLGPPTHWRELPSPPSKDQP
jgi:hypothetical protein